ncbi:MAG: hypothetical protein UX13_C0003G0003 [Candidatus Woesebacteria bacterium GW2011_GWB1_45_5]|uniref:Uncharacterized protein n=1 Tax=Candidatus Woesebacteria bacterium GW2011_GWB1_45_5 TaxID=1618581 RepID=A0A0G1MR12_9BACT|nr:MAG: hypothetical protein UX13_C0003G0003 [Candidatus Woesebacteria bacterium GW2011_GWB1_45_5]
MGIFSNKSEINLLKSIVLLNFLLVGSLLLVLSFMLSVTISDKSDGSLIKTIAFEESEAHPVYWFGFSPQMVLIGSVILGLLWGGFYALEVVNYNRAYISVPNLFSATPSALEKTLDVSATSYMVGTIEELLFSGVYFPVLWAICFLLIRSWIGENFTSLFVALVIASLLTGFSVAFYIHDVAYQGNLYAKADSFYHFTGSAFVTGATGTVVAPTIAHIIHNFSVKLFYRVRTFQVISPQAFQAIQGAGGQG